MEDITPLNLEDHPKLFGLKYNQLVAIFVSLILSTQLYSWLNPVMIAGQDLRLYFCIFIFLIGPFYAVLNQNDSATQLDKIANYFVSCQIFMPGPDPNPVRFLTDEALPEFSE